MVRRRINVSFAVIVLLAGFSITGVAQAQAAATTAQVAKDSPPPEGVWVKLQETLNPNYSAAGEKISAVLQGDAMVNGTKLSKGSKLTGSVMKSVHKDKNHANSGLVLLFDTALPKSGPAIPVNAVLVSLAPSLSDEVEQIEMGSGQITDASMGAAVLSGGFDDPNNASSKRTSTRVNGGRRASSSIKGVLLFASGDATSSGTIVARQSELQLTKWTRMNVVLTAR